MRFVSDYSSLNKAQPTGLLDVQMIVSGKILFFSYGTEMKSTKTCRLLCIFSVIIGFFRKLLTAVKYICAICIRVDVQFKFVKYSRSLERS